MGKMQACEDAARAVGRKEGAAVPTSNTISPGPRRTSVPSGILIRPAVSPQYEKMEAYFQSPKIYGNHNPQMISAIGSGHCGRKIIRLK